MTGAWERYSTSVDERPAVILVDLGLAERAPIPALPALCLLSLTVRESDGNGLPGPEEGTAIGELEDALDAFVADAFGKAAAYAGRCATNGRCDLFFYLQRGEGWSAALERFMAGTSPGGCTEGYEWESGVHDDPDWSVYRDFLFPQEREVLAIQNERARRALAEKGDDLARSRFVDHWAEFVSDEAARAFAQAVRALGFTPAPAEPALPDSGEECAACLQVRFSRPDAPNALDPLVVSLADLAREHGGAYKGWACPVADKTPDSL